MTDQMCSRLRRLYSPERARPWHARSSLSLYGAIPAKTEGDERIDDPALQVRAPAGAVSEGGERLGARTGDLSGGAVRKLEAINGRRFDGAGRPARGHCREEGRRLHHTQEATTIYPEDGHRSERVGSTPPLCLVAPSRVVDQPVGVSTGYQAKAGSVSGLPALSVPPAEPFRGEEALTLPASEQRPRHRHGLPPTTHPSRRTRGDAPAGRLAAVAARGLSFVGRRLGE